MEQKGITQYEYDALMKLREISRKLHRLDEGDCNGRYSERAQKAADTRTENLEKSACELAAIFGLLAYHQSDPRGCSLYLITEEQKKSGDYSRGVGIWYK